MNDWAEILEIERLKARYFRCMDTKQWEAFGGCFTEDATLQASPDPEHLFVGRTEIVRRVSEALRDATTVHHGHMPEIALQGENVATGIWAMEDFVELPDLVLRGWGHYHERYSKEDGVWRIRESRLTRLRLDLERKAERGGA